MKLWEWKATIEPELEGRKLVSSLRKAIDEQTIAILKMGPSRIWCLLRLRIPSLSNATPYSLHFR